MPRQSLAPARLGAACVFAAASLWGLWPVWVRSGGVGGAQTATIALAVAGLCALPIAIRDGRGRGRRTGRGWALVFGLGFVNAANSWFYFRALAEGVVAPAVLSHYLAPVLVALVAPALLGEPRSSRTPIALLLALGGTAILLFGGGHVATGHTRTAVTLGASSAAFYASAVIIAKLASREFTDAEMFAYLAIVGAAMLLPVTGVPSEASRWLWPAAGGVVSALVPGLLYYVGLRRIAAERVAVLTYWEVPAAVIVGWIAYGEAPAQLALLGGAAILAAGVMVVTAPT